MPMMTSWVFPIFFLVISFFFSCSSCTFTITNNCPYTIWPGTLAGAGTPQLSSTGFRLDSGQSVSIPTIPGWSGRLWARTGCTFDESGAGKCQTGDCGGRLECDGMGAIPPASLFEITLGTGNGLDFYDVSLVDGYNIPLIAAPRGASGACNATGCAANINMEIKGSGSHASAEKAPKLSPSTGELGGDLPRADGCVDEILTHDSSAGPQCSEGSNQQR
nr:thaumatin-like protein 1 [Quercus suber]